MRMTDGVDVPAGKRGFTWIPVTTTARGSELRLPLHIANGSEDGPTLGLCCVVHGDAMYPVEIVRNALEKVDLNQLRGRILAIPVANPVAFESGTRATGLGLDTDKNNLNRVFPGNPDGWLTEKIAFAITEHFFSELDFLIDFHCGGLDHAIDYTRIDKPPTPYGDKVLEVSRMYGSEVLCIMEYESARRDFPGTLTGLAEEKNVVAVLSEIGGNMMFNDPKYLERTTDGIFNVMRHCGMLEGEAVLPEKQSVIHERCLLRPQCGGLFYPRVGYDKLAQTVPGGTVLAEVISPYTFERLEVMTAPYESTMLISMRGDFSRVNPGDYAYILGNASTADILSA